MSKNIFSDAAFADWLAKQPANETYDYTEPRGCAIARYLTESGIEVHGIVVNHLYRSPTDKGRSLSRNWWQAALHPKCDRINDKADWTYGAALERLRRYSPRLNKAKIAA